MACQKLFPDHLTLGFVLNNLRTRYSSLLWPGVRDYARDHRLNLIFFPGENIDSPYGWEYQQNIAYDWISPRTVDALIVCPGTICNYESEHETHQFIERIACVPTVLIGVRHPDYPSILIDNRSGIVQAVDHLVHHHGFKEIAFIRGPLRNAEAIERFEAYLEALKLHGIRYNPQLVADGDFGSSSGKRAALELVRERGKKFQALIAANDEMALGALNGLRECGLKVPHDVAIIGFDNIQDAQTNEIPITTVRQPLYEVSRAAAEMAHRILQGEHPVQRDPLPAKLIIRSSCGCFSESIAFIDRAENMARPADSVTYRADTLNMFTEIQNPIKREKTRFWTLQFMDFIESHAGKTGYRNQFLRILQSALAGSISTEADFDLWQNLITRLETLASTLSPNTSEKCAEFLEGLFNRARILVGEQTLQKQGLVWSRKEAVSQSFNILSQRLMSSLSFDELGNALTDSLPGLGYDAYFICRFPDEIFHPQSSGHPKHRPPLEFLIASHPPDSAASRTEFENLFPFQIHSPATPGCFVLLPLSFREYQLGALLLSSPSIDGTLMENIRVQISGTLESIRLYQKQRANEAQLIEVNQKLKETDEAKNNFFSNLSHELRTPLTMILGPVEAILSGDYGEKLHYRSEAFFTIQKNGARLLRLINTLLDISRLDAGNLAIRRSAVHLEHLLRKVEALFAPAMKKHHLTMEIHSPKEVGRIWVDRELFEIIFFNLISNAIKFSPAGQSIILTSTRVNHKIKLSVEDHGPGISEEISEKLFLRNRGLESPDSSAHSGGGIGLSFSHELAGLLGGRLHHENKPDGGCKFTLTLPYEKPPEHLLDDDGIDPSLALWLRELDLPDNPSIK